MKKLEISKLSFSSISTFMECPRKFYFQKKVKKQIPEGQSLLLGKVIHHLLMQYYLKKEVPFDKEYPEDIVNLARGIVDKYKRFYSIEDKHFEVVSAEEEFNFKRKGVGWVGIADLVFKKEGKLYIMDHKYTTRRFREPFTQLSLQSTLYHYYYSHILGLKVDGFVYNIISGPNKMNKSGISEHYNFERFYVYKNNLEIENMWAIIDASVNDIKKQKFIPHISRLTCDYCPYVEECIALQKGFEINEK